MVDKLDITMEDEGAGVSADALRRLLSQTLAFLESEPGGGDGISWRVTQVSMNSPFSMTVERRLPKSMPEPVDRPGERLARLFATLAAGGEPDDTLSVGQARRAAAIAEVAEPGRPIVLRASRGNPINLAPQWAGRLKEWIHRKTVNDVMPQQYYSAAGRLEGVDVHGRKSEFYVYDPLTDQKMRCVFNDELLDQVKNSLYERVEVTGLTRFNANEEPVRMEVESMRVIQSRPFLSRLKDAQARGIMNLTGGLSIEDALGEVRDAAG